MARRANPLHVFNDSPLLVFQNAFRTRLTAQPVVVGELETLLAAIIDVGEADQVAGNLAGGIKPAVFAQHVDTREVELGHLSGFRR